MRLYFYKLSGNCGEEFNPHGNILINQSFILGGNAGPGEHGQGNITSKEGTPSNDITTSNNSSQGGPKGQREQRTRNPRIQSGNKPKETLVNGTSG